MLTYTNQFPRNVLAEGRNKGPGFCFCKLEGDQLIAVGPLSPCKDYLNDQVYSEITGKPYGAYGYNSVKTGCFEGGKAHLVMSICQQGARNPQTYDTYEKEVEVLNQDHSKVQAFLNAIESDLKLTERTKVTLLAPNVCHIEAPIFWVQGTYLTSLYTLLLRVGFGYTPEVGWLAYAKLGFKNYEDNSYMGTALPKLQKMIEGKVPKQDFTQSKHWHNEGIVAFNHKDWQ